MQIADNIHFKYETIYLITGKNKSTMTIADTKMVFHDYTSVLQQLLQNIFLNMFFTNLLKCMFIKP